MKLRIAFAAVVALALAAPAMAQTVPTHKDGSLATADMTTIITDERGQPVKDYEERTLVAGKDGGQPTYADPACFHCSAMTIGKVVRGILCNPAANKSASYDQQALRCQRGIALAEDHRAVLAPGEQTVIMEDLKAAGVAPLVILQVYKVIDPVDFGKLAAQKVQ